MKFSADEIASVIQQEIEQYDSQIDVREVGTVLEVGDGIARVHGLTGVAAGEMVEFPGGIIGLAFNLEENSVGIIILGDYLKINEGDEVKALGYSAVGSGGRCRDRSRPRSAGKSARWQGAGQCQRNPAGRNHRARCGRAATGARADADRDQGGGCHDAGGPRPA